MINLNVSLMFCLSLYARMFHHVSIAKESIPAMVHLPRSTIDHGKPHSTSAAASQEMGLCIPWGIEANCYV